MKKLVSLLLLLLLTFASMISCQRSVTYEDIEQCVFVLCADPFAFQLEQDEELVILNVLNQKTWKSGGTKTAPEYEIVVLDAAGNRSTLHYSYSVINDRTNDRYLRLSQEEIDQIRSILKQYVDVND